MSADPSPRSRWAVAIVTGGSSTTGREVAGGLAGWAWPVVLVYLDHQEQTEATVSEIIAAGGTMVTVRADLADDLDVQRVFTEASAAFGDVDVVVHTTTEYAAFLYDQAVRYVRQHGALVRTDVAEPVPPDVVSALERRGITLGVVPEEAVLDFLDGWRQQHVG
jgi:short-subunit dehydrogenase involved in D-alanine esterification of teichoic acids